MRLKRIPRQGCVSSGDGHSSTPLSAAARLAPASDPPTVPAQRSRVTLRETALKLRHFNRPYTTGANSKVISLTIELGGTFQTQAANVAMFTYSYSAFYI